MDKSLQDELREIANKLAGQGPINRWEYAPVLLRAADALDAADLALLLEPTK